MNDFLCFVIIKAHLFITNTFGQCLFPQRVHTIILIKSLIITGVEGGQRMNTLSELKDKLYMEHYIDVQEEYQSFADASKLLSDYIDNKYFDRLTRIDNSRSREIMLDEWYMSESNKLSHMSIHQKMSMVYVDENLIIIINNSAEIFKIALEKVSDDVSIEQKSRVYTLLHDIQNTMPLVAEFNQDIAQKELSEAIVEVNYILGKSQNLSIRMHDRLQYGKNETNINNAKQSSKKSIVKQFVKSTWFKFGVMTACICLMVLATVFVLNNNAASEPKIDLSDNYANTIVCVGYTGNSAFYEGALNYELLYNKDAKHLPIFKIESLKELKQFEKAYSDILSFDRGFSEIISQAQLDKRSFYKERSLLIIYMPASSGSYRYALQEIKTENTSLCIEVEQIKPNSGMGTLDVEGYLLLVCVDDAELSKYTSIDAQLFK